MHRDNWEHKTRMHIPYDGTEPVILLHPEDLQILISNTPT